MDGWMDVGKYITHVSLFMQDLNLCRAQGDTCTLFAAAGSHPVFTELIVIFKMSENRGEDDRLLPSVFLHLCLAF